MTTESSVFWDVARHWMAGQAPSQNSTKTGLATEDESVLLSRWTHEISRLSQAAPSPDAMEKAGRLFDEIAAIALPTGAYGEKFEIAAFACFVAWRNAYLMNQEQEAQQWIRISESLAAESTADRERLEAFLYLPDGVSSERLCDSFLGTSIDLFLSLAILRGDRLRRPLCALKAAERIFLWCSTGKVAASSDEVSFFAVESATLAATIYRTLGRREFRGWLPLARRHLRGMKCQGPAKTRLHILNLLLRVEQHRFHAVAGLQMAGRDSLRWGNYREFIVSRFATAVALKTRGTGGKALELFNELVEETANTEFQSIRALSLCHIAELMALAGDVSGAIGIQHQAVEIAVNCTDRLSFGSVLLQVGAFRADRGDSQTAISLFEVAFRYYRSIGAGYWSGYALLVLAETRIAVEEYKTAFESLRLAAPIIQRERMVVEGLHAMTLLQRISPHIGTENVRQVMLDFQGAPT